MIKMHFKRWQWKAPIEKRSMSLIGRSWSNKKEERNEYMFFFRTISLSTFSSVLIQCIKKFNAYENRKVIKQKICVSKKMNQSYKFPVCLGLLLYIALCMCIAQARENMYLAKLLCFFFVSLFKYNNQIAFIIGEEKNKKKAKTIKIKTNKYFLDNAY